MKIETRSDLKKLPIKLDAIARSQLPFATVKTLTQIAAEFTKEVKAKLPEAFKLRGDYIKNSFRFVQAFKHQWPNATATAGTLFEPMELHELGGDKKSKRRPFVAVPLAARDKSNSAIDHKLLISRVEKMRGAYKLNAKDGRRYQIVYTAQSKRKKACKGKKQAKNKVRHTRYIPKLRKRSQIKVFYLLKPTARMLPILKMEQHAKEFLMRNYEQKFLDNLDHAIKTRIEK